MPAARVSTRPPGARVVPDKPALEGLETKWAERWKADGMYASPARRGSGTGARAGVQYRHPAAHRVGFAARGARVLLTQTDLIARYQRMRGKHVFYPIGWNETVC